MKRFSLIGRKAVASLSIAAAALAGLTSCSSADNTSAQGTTPLTLWYWPNSLDDAVVEDAKKEFPEVKFTVLKSADVLTKFQASLATGSAPDISMVGGNVGDYFAAGDKLVDYTTTKAYQTAAPDYLPSLTKLGTAPDGAVYGVPVSSSPFLFYYKPEAMQQFGLPSEPEEVTKSLATWEDYTTAAKKVAEDSGGKTMICGQGQTMFMAALAQEGQRFLSPEGDYIAGNDVAQKAWDRNVELRDAGACPRMTGPNDFTAGLVSGQISGFVGYGYQGAALTQTLPDESGQWRVAPVPGGAAQDGGSFLVVSKKTKDPELAARVVTWITNAENQEKAWENIKSFPSNTRAFDLPALNAPDEYYGRQEATKVMSGVLDQAPFVHRGKNDQQMWDLLNQAQQELSTSTISGSEIWKQVQEKVQGLAK